MAIRESASSAKASPIRSIGRNMDTLEPIYIVVTKSGEPVEVKPKEKDVKRTRKVSKRS